MSQQTRENKCIKVDGIIAALHKGLHTPLEGIKRIFIDSLFNAKVYLCLFI